MIKNKTIFIAHNWSDASVAQQSKALAIALSESNQVIFLSAKKNGHHNKKVNDQLIVYEWPGKRPTGFVDFVFAMQLFRKYKPHIAITNFAANNIMLLASRIAGTRIRMCYHHTLLEQILTDNSTFTFKKRLFIKRKALIYTLATHILACSSAAKNDLLKNYNLPPTKAFVFPNAIADRNFKSYNAAAKTIGFIGRLDYSKGVDILIEAFKQVQLVLPTTKLVIVGEGKQRQALTIQASKCKDNVTFAGMASYTEVFKYLQTFTCLVVPSRIDNLPTVVLEAFSCYTPVIGSNRGGIPDMIEDNYNGLLFEKENAVQLAGKILFLLNNNDERCRLAGNAREIFLQKFCVNTLPSRFEQLLTTTHYL